MPKLLSSGFIRSRSKTVLKGAEYNTDENGEAIQSDREVKGLFHPPSKAGKVTAAKGDDLPLGWKPGQPIGVAL